MQRALPACHADEIGRIRKQQARRLTFFPSREQTAGVVEMQVRDDDGIDVLVRKAGGAQRIEEYVMTFDDAVALPQTRFEERADAGLEQDGLAIEVVDEQRAAGERDAVVRVGRDPFLPDRLRRVAEHRAAIELLRVAEDRPQLHELLRIIDAEA